MGVEHDRPPRRAGGVADVRTPPVTQPARGGRHPRGQVQRRQPSPVRRGGHRLARDELAQQPVLAARVLDRHPTPPVGGRSPSAPAPGTPPRSAPLRPAGTSRAPAPRPPPPRGSSGPRPRGPASPAGPAPAARRGRARVVALHVAHHQQLALDRLTRLDHRRARRTAPTTPPGTAAGRCAPATARARGPARRSPPSRPTDSTATCRCTDDRRAAAGHLDRACQRGRGVVHVVGEGVQVIGRPGPVVDGATAQPVRAGRDPPSGAAATPSPRRSPAGPRAPAAPPSR